MPSYERPDIRVQSDNMRLIAHCDLAGNGNGGEGIALRAAGGRRTLYIAHENAPVNFSVVDVTDPRAPRLIKQTLLPHASVRSNSLAAVGDILAVVYQVKSPGGRPAGLELFDISRPDDPRPIAFFDTSGPRSRGAHFVWFVDGRYAYISSGMPDFVPSNPLDDQVSVIVDLSDPSHPVEAGRWWLPGTRAGDAEPAPARHPRFDYGYRSHNVNVYPDRPDRAYVGYLDGGVVILDLSDHAHPTLISRLGLHPPLPGFTHTVLPLLERGLLAVTDESILDAAEDYPKMLWIMDGSVETNIVPLATAPLPPAPLRNAGGRYGTHNIHENEPLETAFHSEEIVVGAFFNGGIRAFDITDPFQPRLAGYLLPEAPPGSPAGAIQMNDVYVDEAGIIYAVDRFAGGLYVIEFSF